MEITNGEDIKNAINELGIQLSTIKGKLETFKVDKGVKVVYPLGAKIIRELRNNVFAIGTNQIIIPAIPGKSFYICYFEGYLPNVGGYLSGGSSIKIKNNGADINIFGLNASAVNAVMNFPIKCDINTPVLIDTAVNDVEITIGGYYGN